jgi:hypothetical protein
LAMAISAEHSEIFPTMIEVVSIFVVKLTLNRLAIPERSRSTIFTLILFQTFLDQTISKLEGLILWVLSIENFF